MKPISATVLQQKVVVACRNICGVTASVSRDPSEHDLDCAFPTAVSRSAEPRQKDFGTVQRWWDANWDVGKGISDLLVERLVSDGTLTVVERRRLESVRAEQNFSNDEYADPASAIRIGTILGANALIFGSVTHWSNSSRRQLPTQRSAIPVCQGDCMLVRLGVRPVALRKLAPGHRTFHI
jgi:curli biogenesis system outer membrane secretion channel CsgG